MLKHGKLWAVGGGLALSFLFGGMVSAQEAEAVFPEEVLTIPIDGEQVKILGTSFEETAIKEDPCAWPHPCYVPAPTLVSPAPEDSYAGGRSIIITGLSWNQTKVDIYIDGVYNGRADLRTDPSEVGNFVYRPFLPLTPGRHFIYTVARNLSELERSPQSPTVFFSVQALSQAAPAAASETVPADEGVPAAQEEVETPAGDTSANQVLEDFFNQEVGGATSSATTTTEASTSTRVIVVVIVLAAIIAAFIFLRRNERVDTQAPPDQHAPPDDNQPTLGI